MRWSAVVKRSVRGLSQRVEMPTAGDLRPDVKADKLLNSLARCARWPGGRVIVLRRVGSAFVAMTLAVVLVGCSSSNELAARKSWCEASLGKVAAAGTTIGSAFHFASRADVTWTQYLQDSEVEQGIVVAEAPGGQAVWDTACDRAYTDAHPGASPQPLPSPSS